MDVRLPNLGEGADSGSVVNVFVKEGDFIQKGQTILELENEKAVAPIPSPSEGKIRQIRVKTGDKISVGQVILTLDAETPAAPRPGPRPPAPEEPGDTSPAETAPQSAEPEPESESNADVSAPARSSAFPPPASPSIRKLARDLGIDLTRVKGSQPGGRIVLADLKKHIEHMQRLAFGPKPKQTKTEKPAPVSIDFSKWGPILKKPFSPLRQTISQRMVESWTAIPHVTQFDEADLSIALELRKKHQAAYGSRGVRLTLTPLIMKAVVSALRSHPIFNTSLDEATRELVWKEYYHFGIAVDTESGLLVPVIRDVDKKSVLDLSKELNELAEKARDRKVTLEELKGGSFTITNQGGIGGAHFTPIINRPEVAILGLGRAAVKAVVREGKIEPRTLLPLCLSYDHRVIDGGQAARFIVELRERLEQIKEDEVRVA